MPRRSFVALGPEETHHAIATNRPAGRARKNGEQRDSPLLGRAAHRLPPWSAERDRSEKRKAAQHVEGVAGGIRSSGELVCGSDVEINPLVVTQVLAILEKLRLNLHAERRQMNRTATPITRRSGRRGRVGGAASGWLALATSVEEARPST